MVLITNNKTFSNFLGEISSLEMKKGTTFEKKAELKLKSDEGAAGGSNGTATGSFIENATEDIIGFGTGPWQEHGFVTFVEFKNMTSLRSMYMGLFKVQQPNASLEYSTGRPLQLLALGGSVTAGNGPTKMNWVELVEKRSFKQWNHSGTFIEATNGGIGAVDCNIFPSCLGRLGAYKADVIVVDLSLNAKANGPVDDFFRTITTLPNKPLVIYLDLTSVGKQSLEEDWRQESPNNPATLAPKHGIPVLSHREVMAKYWGQEPFTEELMYPTEDKQHMIDMGHDLVSMMVVDFLQSRLQLVNLPTFPTWNYTDPLCLSNYSFLASNPQHKEDSKVPWPEEFSEQWYGPINRGRPGQKEKMVIVLNTTGQEDVPSTQVALNIDHPCTLNIGVEQCGIPGECDHHGIISAQVNYGTPIVSNLHGRGDPHEPYLFRLQRLVTVGTVGVGKHTLTITSAGDRDSIIVLAGLYCVPLFGEDERN